MTGNESPGSTEPAPGTLGAILAKTSKGMADKLAELREGLDHPGEKGSAAEEIVAGCPLRPYADQPGTPNQCRERSEDLNDSFAVLRLVDQLG